jgi:hypothetical protein
MIQELTDLWDYSRARVMLDSTLTPDRAMLQNWNLYKEIFYSVVVCVYKAWVGGIYKVPRSTMWWKLSWRRCCRGVDGRHVWRHIPAEDLISAGFNVGPADHPAGPTWQGLQPMGSTWSEVDRGDLGLTFCWTSSCDIWKAPNFIPSS